MAAVQGQPLVFVARSPSDPTADVVVAALVDGGCAILPRSAGRRSTAAARTKAVTDAMEEAGAMLVVASADTAGSPWTAFEMGAALATGKPIYVVPVTGVLMPTYMQPAEVVEPSSISRLVRRLRDDAVSLTPDEQAALADVYARFGVPTDRLAFDTPTLKRMAGEFGRRGHPKLKPDRLARELMTLRKLGHLSSSTRRRSAGRSAHVV